MASRSLFTSESVSMGHPDKMCDQISDAILDAMLAQDPASRVACETATTTGLVLVCGEVTTQAQVEIPTIVRNVVHDIGYTSSEMGFDAATCAVQVAIGKQSPDISQGVSEGEGLHKEQGAGGGPPRRPAAPGPDLKRGTHLPKLQPPRSIGEAQWQPDRSSRRSRCPWDTPS